MLDCTISAALTGSHSRRYVSANDPRASTSGVSGVVRTPEMRTVPSVAGWTNAP
jgi:hypothetical protein